FSSLEEVASLAFHFNDQAAFDHVQQFLRAGMHVPGSRAARREFDDADDGFLNYLTLALEIVAQDLGKLRSPLRLFQRNGRERWSGHCEAGQPKKLAANDCHCSLPLTRPRARGPSRS